ncbi:hypothetical protein PINS_up009159 [Pythium insidiosum]|nr:hypothetical protein PINS_up009159 [Pythium insidiosum]
MDAHQPQRSMRDIAASSSATSVSQAAPPRQLDPIIGASSRNRGRPATTHDAPGVVLSDVSGGETPTKRPSLLVTQKRGSVSVARRASQMSESKSSPTLTGGARRASTQRRTSTLRRKSSPDRQGSTRDTARGGRSEDEEMDSDDEDGDDYNGYDGAALNRFDSRQAERLN